MNDAKYANGLGPRSWWRWNALLPFSGRFFYVAITHDYDYTTGGNERERREADERFLLGCLEASWNNHFAIFMSCVYFLLVHYFWYKYFYYN